VNDNVSVRARRAAVAFLGWLEGEGYANMRLRPTASSRVGDWVAIRKEGFMWGVTTGVVGDRDGCLDRWLYSTFEAAHAALLAWDEGSAPLGWRFHPKTGQWRPDGSS
jgi:hypothetical protein